MELRNGYREGTSLEDVVTGYSEDVERRTGKIGCGYGVLGGMLNR